MPEEGRSQVVSPGSGSQWPTTDLVAARAAATPDRVALVDAPTDESWTYRELDGFVDRAAGRLHAETAPGGRVAVLSAPRPAVVALLHAAWRSGRELVPLNTELAASALARQLAVADVGHVFTDERTHEVVTAATERADSPDHLTVRTLETVSDANEAATDADANVVAPDDVPVTLFTSGSTGDPKPVQLTVENLVSSATASAFRLGVTREDRWLSPLPTYHMGGLAPVVRCALYGSTVVLQRAFDTEPTADALRAYDATGISLVPTALKRLLDVDWRPPESLRFVLLGGAAASTDLLERCEAADVPVHPSYGMTETASQIATATPEQVFADPETVGQPLVNTTVAVVAPDGSTCPSGEEGELVVSGPTVTPGYLDAADDDPRSSAARRDGAFTDRGFRTGDRGYRDDDGKMYVTGRVDDMIVTGGENVQPAVVEDALRDLESVQDAAVVGIPDAEWGERVTALVVPAGAGSADTTFDLDTETIRDSLRGSLATHELPKDVAFTTGIPRTASGTVDRDAIRERHLQHRDGVADES
jgi:O-succinylbenzoic acid--CoA ligase